MHLYGTICRALDAAEFRENRTWNKNVKVKGKQSIKKE